MKSLQTYTNILSTFYQKHKRMPSYAEVTVLFGLSSKDSAYRTIARLIDEGIVAKDETGKLIPTRLTSHSLRVLGLVEAGFPASAEEAVLDTISLDEWLIENKEASFMLEVKGDSMIDAGIHEGDMIIVERTTSAVPGDIVVAEVDGAWTLKYLKKDKQGAFILVPGNSQYPSIRPEESLQIGAVLRAVIRKY